VKPRIERARLSAVTIVAVTRFPRLADEDVAREAAPAKRCPREIVIS